MADAVHKALRKPDFVGRTIEEGDSPEAQEQKEPIFSDADAAIMADAFRRALRNPDFAGRTTKEGDSPEAQEQKKHQLLSSEFASGDR